MDETRSPGRLDSAGSATILAVIAEAAESTAHPASHRSQEHWYARILAAIDEALRTRPSPRTEATSALTPAAADRCRR